MGLEPTTTRLKVEGSTTELPALGEGDVAVRTRAALVNKTITTNVTGLGLPLSTDLSVATSQPNVRHVSGVCRDTIGGFRRSAVFRLGAIPVLIVLVSLSAPRVRAQSSGRTAPSTGSYGQLQTPDRSGTANLQNAVSAPLHDLNIMRQGIPTVLISAVADPYAPPMPLSCQLLAQDITELDAALGVDFNAEGTPQSPSLTRNNGHIALALVQSGARLLLPYSGLVSTVTGARRHDQEIIEAITAGSVRRGYLKGLGEAYRCAPPATPAHRTDGAVVLGQRGQGPAYPIR